MNLTVIAALAAFLVGVCACVGWERGPFGLAEKYDAAESSRTTCVATSAVVNAALSDERADWVGAVKSLHDTESADASALSEAQGQCSADRSQTFQAGVVAGRALERASHVSTSSASPGAPVSYPAIGGVPDFADVWNGVASISR